MKQLAFLISLLFIFTNISAQSADEIINKYFENTGGVDNWNALTGVKFESIVKDNDMDIPSTRIALKDGRVLMIFQIQDKEIVQIAFDGKETWGDNFITNEAEKNGAESTKNMIRDARDFPHPLLTYNKNGYSVEYIGKEQVVDNEYYKLKFNKDKQVVDNQELDNIKYYYFNIETYLIEILESEIQTGKLKGKITRDVFSDYRKVGDLQYPFSITRTIEGMNSTEIKITSIELNPEVNDSDFIFPEKKK